MSTAPVFLFLAMSTAESTQYYQITHIDDGCCTAVQMFVQIVEHLPQLLHGLLARLQQHGLEVHWQPVSIETTMTHMHNEGGDFLIYCTMRTVLYDCCTLKQTPQTPVEL